MPTTCARGVFPVVLAALVALASCVFPAAGPTGATTATVVAPTAHDHGDTPGQGEGFPLGAASTVSRPPGARCAPTAPVQAYDVVALAVDLTLNRYLDHDPLGRMFALAQNVDRIRAEEADNTVARNAPERAAGPTLGLQGDAVEPLTLRVRPGECLRIRFRNALPDGEGATVDLHGATLVATSPEAAGPAPVVPAGRTVELEWPVAPTEPEGTHYFHSTGPTERGQTNHGLFGAVIVEPAGSVWTDPRTAAPLRTGWDAVIAPPSGSAFREFALYYHEIGDETYQVLDRAGQFLPLVDPITHAYRPGSRALNYRSEPFLDRLSLQQAAGAQPDESLAYSSYAFGDPATPVLRSYVGDPVKQRLVHAGSETLHVHHVHGGAVRWPRQPGEEAVAFDAGLDKHPPLRPQRSETTDAQSVGPSETYDLVSTCGSGGCQQSAGDFMVHCHVFHHYFAGMWGLWRVYDTLQDGHASTDAFPPLPPLPDRRGRVAAAVTSDGLLGRVVDRPDGPVTVGPAELAALVTRQLPPPGVPRGYDASVLDWTRAGAVYLGEPETNAVWPGYRSRAPGTRPPLLFDPRTGALAYPFLRPHLGRRPPFAPEHGPAPFLDPARAGPEPPPPGANGPASLCPAGTRLRTLDVEALPVPVPLDAAHDLVDPAGTLFVLRDRVDAVRADPTARVPLVVRANAGEECLDVLLRSELTDGPETPLSKASAHVHFMQFDVQASDGVTTGFNYEQTVRPFRVTGTGIVTATAPGATGVAVADPSRFQPGTLVGVGLDRAQGLEFRHVSAVAGAVLTLDAPLAQAHAAGEVVGTEFVRYRWYPDAQFGTAFFHDHTNVLASGRHGLFGAVIVEPPGSTYHDPVTGAEIASGPVADVHTRQPVSADVAGSFREFTLLLQDDNPLTSVGASAGGTINLRAAPLSARGRDPTQLFSSAADGDPATPLLRAYLGDPVVVRTLVGAANDVHTWHLDGHWFRREPWSTRSPPVDTVAVGIAERFDLSVPHAGGPQRLPGDYLYYSGRAAKLAEGNWGILRVLGSPETGLRTLPGHETVSPPAAAVCPADAPHRSYDVTAVSVPLPMLDGDPGTVFVLAADSAATVAGRRSPTPLVLHVGVGDCVEMKLTNTTSGPVSLHPDLLAFDPRTSAGVAAGRNPPQSVPPGATGSLTWFAAPELGQPVALLRDWADVTRNPALGAYGAIVVGPAGARYTDPVTGADAAPGAGDVTVTPPDGRPYRDVSLFLQDGDAAIGTHRMPYNHAVRGVVGVNYRAAPVADQRDGGPPATPTVDVRDGDRLRLTVVVPSSEQIQTFGVQGQRWQREPGTPGTDLVAAEAIGGLEARSLWIDVTGPPGDFRYGAERAPFREAGVQGVFRVRPACPGAGACTGVGATLATAAGAAAVLLAGLAGGWIVRRRRRRARMRR